MKRLVQKINDITSYSYDKSGFEELNGIKKFDSNNNPYIYYEFALTDSGSAYFTDDKESFNSSDILLNTVDVKIYSDTIKICHPYIPTEEWVETANKNIINLLMNEFESFSCSLEEYTKNENYYIGCPHPHLESKDIIHIFNNESLYDFTLEKFTKKELNNINISIQDEIELYVLRDGLDNKIDIYYSVENNSFYFGNENLINKFNKMIFNLLLTNLPYNFTPEKCPELIDSGVLVLWIYWHGEPTIHYWNYIKQYLYLDVDESYSRKNAFNYVRSNIPYHVSNLQLRRIEADLIELLSYEYPITNINRNKMISYFESRCNKNINKILWDEGLKYNINSYVDVSASQDSFNYEQDIGFKGDIIYYESDKIPIKIALQLKKYDSVIPLEKDVLNIEKYKDTTPFAWYGKIIGVKKLDEEITKSDIKNVFNIDSLFLLYNSIFDEASQLRLKDLDTQLDIIFNQPDTTVWD